MKRKLLFVSLAVIMVLSIFATACTDKGSNAGGQGDGKPQDGGKATVAIFSAFTNKFNPILADDQYTQYPVNYTFESLLTYDDKLQIKENLLESWEFSQDKKTLTVKLKQGLKWSDGQPITTDDVIYTMEALAHADYTGPYFSLVAWIKGAQEYHDKKADKISGLTKVDDQTLKIEAVEPKANALDQLAGIAPIPKHVFENVPVKDMATAEGTTKADKIVTSGPFKFKEIKENEYVVLERNPNFTKAQKPHLDQVIIKVVSQDVAVGALKKGDVDIIPQLKPKEYEALKNDKNITLKETGDFGYQYMGFNLKDPKLQNKKLRQAIYYAIDRKALVDGLLKGHGYVLNQHIVKASWAYNKDLESAYPYDINKAKSLLAEAGYKDVNGDGFVEDPQGKPFTLALDYPTGNPVREKSAPIIVENLKKAGLNVTLNKPRDANTHYDAVRDGKTQMFLAGWSLTPDPDPAGIWLSTDQFNYIKYNNPESDKLIQDATGPEGFDQAKRKEMYKKWTEMINEDAPQVFLYGENRIEGWNNNRLHGVVWGWKGAVEQPDGILSWWVSK